MSKSWACSSASVNFIHVVDVFEKFVVSRCVWQASLSFSPKVCLYQRKYKHLHCLIFNFPCILFFFIYRQTVMLILAYISLTSHFTLTSSYTVANEASSVRLPLTLDNYIHSHLGISKRDTGNLLNAAKIAPDQCLENQHFQEMMNALIQVSYRNILFVVSRYLSL